jgi:hypothetical protein
MLGVAFEAGCFAMNMVAGAILLLAAMQGQPQPITVVSVSEEQLPSFDPIGNCEGHGRSVDMRRVMFLENRSVDVDGPGGPFRLSIQGEELVAEGVHPGPERPHFYEDVDSRIDMNSDLDIELKFAYFEGKLTLFWKETFNNRIYRQGLFDIVGHSLTPLCEGRGGSHVER